MDTIELIKIFSFLAFVVSSGFFIYSLLKEARDTDKFLITSFLWEKTALIILIIIFGAVSVFNSLFVVTFNDAPKLKEDKIPYARLENVPNVKPQISIDFKSRSKIREENDEKARLEAIESFRKLKKNG